MLDVLEHFFGTKNWYYRGKDPPLQSERRIHFRVQRRWQLQVWELKGPPESWEAQLHQRDAEPVFAVISGIGGRTWEPVHCFCQSESIPCLLPNVDLPVVAAPLACICAPAAFAEEPAPHIARCRPNIAPAQCGPSTNRRRTESGL